MSIDRDDSDERQTRVDWMIDEFRKAQSRRLVKAPDKAPASPVEPATKVAVDASVTDARPLLDGDTR